MTATRHPEVREAARNGGGIPHGRWLVFAALMVGVLFAGILLVRALTTEQQDRALCEKIDRFIVAAEVSVRESKVLTPSEKATRIQFYEDFRNDPPTCRTSPP